MPERYTLAKSREELELSLGFELPEDFRPRFNAAPAQLLPVITMEAREGFSFFFWGTIPGWAGNKTLSRKLISIPAEHLLTKPMHRSTLREHRCVVPADGFYAWKKVGKKTRIPYRLTVSAGSMVGFAGVWEEFEDENDQVQHSFRIVTVPAEGPVAELEETMPAILDKDAADRWLRADAKPDELAVLLKPSDELEMYTVSSRIDNIQLDDSKLIDRVESMNQHGNYSLFD